MNTDLRCPGCGAEYVSAATGEHAVILAAKGCEFCGHTPLEILSPTREERVRDAVKQVRGQRA